LTEAIFGLVGVVIGAIAQGGIGWLVARRQEDQAARTAGRLVAQRLERCRLTVESAIEDWTTWGEIAAGLKAPIVVWEAQSQVLAGTARGGAWGPLAQVWNAIDRVHERGEIAPDEVVTAQDAEFLARLADFIWEASRKAGRIGYLGVRRRPLHQVRRALRGSRRRAREAEELRLLRHSPALGTVPSKRSR
jgi:hypothetical protein